MAGTTSIEDILSSEVDENALSALIGSLESKVASQSGGAAAGQPQESSQKANHVADTPVSSGEKQAVLQKTVDNNTGTGTHGPPGHRNSTGTGSKNSNSGVKTGAASTPSNSLVNRDVNKESGGATVVIKDNKLNAKSNVVSNTNINNSSNSSTSKINSTITSSSNPSSCVRIITLPTSSGGQVLATDQTGKNATITVTNSRTQPQITTASLSASIGGSGGQTVRVVTAKGLQSAAGSAVQVTPSTTIEGGLKMTVREQLAKQQVTVTKPTIVTTSAASTTPQVVLQPAPATVTITGNPPAIRPALTSTRPVAPAQIISTTAGSKLVTVNVSAPNASFANMHGQHVITSNTVAGSFPTTVKNMQVSAAPQMFSQPMRIAGHQMIAPRLGTPGGPIQVRLPPGTNLPPNVVLINNKDGSLQAVQVGGTIAQPGNIPGTVTYRHVQVGMSGFFGCWKIAENFPNNHDNELQNVLYKRRSVCIRPESWLII